MKMLNNKKGAVEMSLNLIIMLIIGLVVMGLVITFVTSLIGEAGDELRGSLPGDEAAFASLDNCRDNLCMYPVGSEEIVRGDQTPIYIKFRNHAPSGEVSCGAGDLDACTNFTVTFTPAVAGTNTGGVILRGAGIGAPAGESNSERFELTTSDLPPGTYYLSVDLELNGRTDTKRLTLIIQE